jgi:hypothetical protein
MVSGETLQELTPPATGGIICDEILWARVLTEDLLPAAPAPLPRPTPALTAGLQGAGRDCHAAA